MNPKSVKDWADDIIEASSKDSWQELSTEDIESQRGDHEYILIHYCRGDRRGKTLQKADHGKGRRCVLPVNQESVFAQEVGTYGANFARTSEPEFAAKYGIKGEEEEALVLFKQSLPNIYNGDYLAFGTEFEEHL